MLPRTGRLQFDQIPDISQFVLGCESDARLDKEKNPHPQSNRQKMMAKQTILCPIFNVPELYIEYLDTHCVGYK